jgi:hypothetical protein
MYYVFENPTLLAVCERRRCWSAKLVMQHTILLSIALDFSITGTPLLSGIALPVSSFNLSLEISPPAFQVTLSFMVNVNAISLFLSLLFSHFLSQSYSNVALPRRLAVAVSDITSDAYLKRIQQYFYKVIDDIISKSSVCFLCLFSSDIQRVFRHGKQVRDFNLNRMSGAMSPEGGFPTFGALLDEAKYR